MIVPVRCDFVNEQGLTEIGWAREFAAEVGGKFCVVQF
jgi:hypothetical protein